MPLTDTKFKIMIRASVKLCLLVIMCLSSGSFSLFAKDKVSDEDRRSARLQATYITRLVTFISWDANSSNVQGAFKIVVLGDDKRGFVQSLEFLIKQGNIKSEGRSVEVQHYPNAKSLEALEFIRSGVHFIYFTKGSVLTVNDVIPVRRGAMFLSEGRNFVSKNQGCIAFESVRNRLKLVVNETCFRRKFAKVNPVLTSLKSVVEVVKPE